MKFKLGFFSLVLCSLSAGAQTISVEADIRGSSRYYVNAWDLKMEDLRRVGLTKPPGNIPNDDEGYCKIDGPSDKFGSWVSTIKKGEILRVVREWEWKRTVFHNGPNGPIAKEVIDLYSIAAMKDGREVTIGCSITSGASESAPYLPVSSDSTKAYLTILRMFVGSKP